MKVKCVTDITNVTHVTYIKKVTCFKHITNVTYVTYMKKSTCFLLQEAILRGPPTKYLLEKFYSKRSGFTADLKCPVS